MPLSPADAAAKWVARTTAASADYVKGVQAVTQAPGAAAAAKKEKMRAGVMQALDSGKWERNVAAVPLQTWKDAAATKGGQRLAQGVQAAAPKMQGFLQEFLPFQQNIVERSKQMDDTTLEGRLQKMLFVARETSNFRRSGR